MAGEPIIPPIVYLPVADYRPGADNLDLDLRQTPDGRTALLVYTALDRLIKGCGEDQPWVVLPANELDRIKKCLSYDMILLDITIPNDERRMAGDR